MKLYSNPLGEALVEPQVDPVRLNVGIPEPCDSHPYRASRRENFIFYMQKLKLCRIHWVLATEMQRTAFS